MLQIFLCKERQNVFLSTQGFPSDILREIPAYIFAISDSLNKRAAAHSGGTKHDIPSPLPPPFSHMLVPPLLFCDTT